LNRRKIIDALIYIRSSLGHLRVSYILHKNFQHNFQISPIFFKFFAHSTRLNFKIKSFVEKFEVCYFEGTSENSHGIGNMEQHTNIYK
jgi:hypothetical protein